MFGRIVFALTLGLVACSSPKYAPETPNGPQQQALPQGTFTSGKKVSFVWEVRPTEDDFGSFFFRTYAADSRDGFPTLEDLGSSVSVLLWMPGMGHGSSPVTVEHLGVGTYRASKVFFSMRGDWDIRIQLKDGATVLDEAILPFVF